MMLKNYNYKLKNKKMIFFLLFLIIIMLLFVSHKIVLAEGDDDSVTIQLSDAVEDLVNGIDFGELEGIIDELDSVNLFDSSIKHKLNDILNGEYFTNYSSIFTAIISLFIVDIKKFLPFLFMIISIGLLSNLIGELKSDKDSTSNVIIFVCFAVSVTLILFIFKDVLQLTGLTISRISRQIQIIFPLLIALLSSIGAFSTISIYNPLVAVLTTIVNVVFDKLLYPIFIVVFVFLVIGNLTDAVKLNKISDFLSSLFKWIVGIVFTLFSGFLSFQGITAGKFDSVSIKATRFAVKSYIPIIGSYISEGMDFLVLGSVLVKNTIGLVGILILFVTVISPVISILVVKLGLELCSGVLEISGCNKMSSFVSRSSKMLIYPIVIILGVSFMYVITIALIMCTANIF